MSKAEPSLAVALSGGGHRATLFTLGALMYLMDAGVNRQVTSISSVSGGSLTNGLVGQTLNYRTSDGDAFRKGVAIPLASQIAKKGTFFAPLLSKAYIAALVVTGLLVFVPVFTDWAWYIRLPFFLAALALFGWVFGKRGLVCAGAFETTLFSSNGKATLLRDTKQDGIDHVICSTELRSSEAVFFAGSFVYSYCFGHGTPGDLKLARAVQASACFPGGFPPARVSAIPHQFADAPTVEGCGAGQRDELVMSDGGVYDNMGDEWARAFSGRVKTWPGLGKDRVAPDRVVVVNASARFPWKPFSFGRIPIVGEILAITSMLDVMYINTTNVRRQEMVHSFRPDMPPAAGHLPSALIQIAQSPFVVADGFAKGADAAAARANAVRNMLGNTEDEWSKIADANKKVSTSLSKFDADVSARLIYHGYVVTMCNLYVLLGNDFPLRPEMVDINQFRQLIR